jgi:signal transduction histidine kinase
MVDPASGYERSSARVMALVSAALKQDTLSGMSEMLRCIAESVNAAGCLLWELAPGSGLETDPPTGHFFTLASWFRDRWNLALHNLPVNSVVGRAVIEGTTINVPDVRKDPRVFRNHPALQSAPINSFCSIPIRFQDGTYGALNVYSNAPGSFDDAELTTIEELVSLVPTLYENVQHRVSLGLIQHITRTLHEAEIRARDNPLPTDEIAAVMQEICEAVGQTFQSVEASIFLDGGIVSTGDFRLAATTWRGSFRKKTYHSSRKEGLTGWVLSNRAPVRIFDLVHFQRDRELIHRSYPGIQWHDSLAFRQKVRSLLNLTEDENGPPLSFMAAPIMMGDRVLGVIRCCTALKGPYYYTDRELGLLKLIAAHLGQYWNGWLTRREMQEENKSWRNLVLSITRLNKFVHNELTRKAPQELRIFEEALRVTSEVIGGAEIIDVRLLDDVTNDLYVATTHGKAWQEGTREEVRRRKARRFSVLDGRASAGAHVFQTARPYVMRDVYNDPYYSETFPGTKRMIIAPISVEDEKYGVLDIRSTGERDFPSHAEAIAELLGQQLGLYNYLAITIRKLRKAESELSMNIAELEGVQRRQVQAFQDLGHQIKSPIIQAHARVQSALMAGPLDEKLRSNFLAIRGLSAKAKRVAFSAELFAKLAREEPIRTRLTPLTAMSLSRMLIEAAKDNELMVEPRRRISFHVDREDSPRFWVASVLVDYDLLEQAINNLLENAGKYSYEGSRVTLYWGLTGKDRFHISVTNWGLPIRSNEVRKCVERGWRGGLAEATTGEGSGIGLWIVDNIMKSHGGELVVVPTTADGLTEVKLVFSGSKALRGQHEDTGS